MYSSTKKVFTFDSRDFYDKTIIFHHNGKLYKYANTVDNNEEIRPIPEKTKRGCTFISMGIMQRRESDGKVMYACIN